MQFRPFRFLSIHSRNLDSPFSLINRANALTLVLSSILPLHGSSLPLPAAVEAFFFAAIEILAPLSARASFIAATYTSFHSGHKTSQASPQYAIPIFLLNDISASKFQNYFILGHSKSKFLINQISHSCRIQAYALIGFFNSFVKH